LIEAKGKAALDLSLCFSHVPKYLLPRGMQVADLTSKRKRKRPKRPVSAQRRTDNDPLRSFESDGTVLEVEGGAEHDDDGGDNFSEFFDDGTTDNDRSKDKAKRPKIENPKVFASVSDGTGRSTSGRQRWKEKHGKGDSNGKKRRTEGKVYKRLGI
jgi:hypothetical protein